MRLLILCEPLLQYVAKAHRSAAKGCVLPLEKVRGDIQRLFEEMGQQAAGKADLAAQYEKIRLPLIFFVDFMMRESDLSFRADWVPLAFELKEFAGDERFFDLLESDLRDPGEGATERLVIYYSCLGLGFTGLYLGQPEAIQRLMERISPRISRFMDVDRRARICPRAYDHNDTRDFTEPPGTKLVGIGIALILLLLVWFIAYFRLFNSLSGDIRRNLNKILNGPPASVSSSASALRDFDTLWCGRSRWQ